MPSRPPKPKIFDGDFEEVATVYDHDIGPMRKLRARVTMINGKEYIDIRQVNVFVDRESGEDKERYGKGLCLHKDLLPELKEAIGYLDRYYRNIE